MPWSQYNFESKVSKKKYIRYTLQESDSRKFTKLIKELIHLKPEQAVIFGLEIIDHSGVRYEEGKDGISNFISIRQTAVGEYEQARKHLLKSRPKNSEILSYTCSIIVKVS